MVTQLFLVFSLDPLAHFHHYTPDYLDVPSPPPPPVVIVKGLLIVGNVRFLYNNVEKKLQHTLESAF